MHKGMINRFLFSTAGIFAKKTQLLLFTLVKALSLIRAVPSPMSLVTFVCTFYIMSEGLLRKKKLCVIRSCVIKVLCELCLVKHVTSTVGLSIGN